MAKIGIIGGTVFFDSTLLNNPQKKIVKTNYGNVEAYTQKDIVFIQRHGPKKLPPHSINHKANIAAFKKLKIKKIIASNSVGSLKINIKPDSIVVPDDYIQLSSIPTFFDKQSIHITPNLYNDLRKIITDVANKNKIKIISKATYINTIGPRIETKAEINMFKNFADIIGMTMAYEATLAQELGIQYATVCSVDNYAHGITSKQLNYRDVVKLAKKSSKKIIFLIKKVLDALKCQY